MRQRTRLIINSLSGVAARVVTVVTRFIVIPFALGVMGRDVFGIWAVVGGIFAYQRIFEMGLRSAVVRETAYRVERGEIAELNRYINTAVLYFLGVAALLALLTVGLAVAYPHFVEMDPTYQGASRAMVLCVGLLLAVTVAQYAYGAVVSGMQREDLLSSAQVVADVARLVLLLLFLKSMSAGWALVFMAVVTGGTQMLGMTVRTRSAFKLVPGLRFDLKTAQPTLLKGMIFYGVNTVVYVMSVTIAAQLAQVAIGVFLGTDQSSDFYASFNLLVAAHTIITAFNMGTRAAASKYHGAGNEKMLRHLLLRSSRYGGLLAFAAAAGLLVYADDIFVLWIGDELAQRGHADVLPSIAASARILLISFGLYWLVQPGFNVANGIGKHKFFAAAALVAGLVSMALVMVAAVREGSTLQQVSWAVVVPMIPVWGVLLPVYCCWQIGQPLGRYLWEGFALPALGSTPAAICGWLLRVYVPVNGSWWTFLWQVALCGVVWCVSAWFLVMAADDRKHMLEYLHRFAARLRGQERTAG